jgi:hypothetical protein
MSFGHQSDVHKHLFPKHPLVTQRMGEDNAHSKIVEPEQDEQMRLGDPPTKLEEPMLTQSK